jgi:2-iminobutanoate/2-iminopropanoate deaminase
MPTRIQVDGVCVSSHPYSHAIGHGDTLYVAGQVPVDAAGEVVGEDIRTQTEWVLDNLETVLDAADASFADLVKTTVFLTNMDDIGGFNETYGERIPDPKPARSTVEVSDLAVDALVEVEVIAALPTGRN